jgi:hypothetical protein
VGEYVAAFFWKSLFKRTGFFVFKQFAAFSFAQSGIALESFEKPVKTNRLFCYQYIVPMGLSTKKATIELLYLFLYGRLCAAGY